MTEIAPQRVILALESSADLASAAVLAGGGIAVQHTRQARHGHAALITELASGALAEAGITADGLTHVAAGRGPGSFTGIRVALAAAKGFVIATGAQGLGVSCLAAAAHAARRAASGDHPVILATADTRRGSFFVQPFDGNAAAIADIGEWSPDGSAAVPQSWRGAVVTGPGAAMLAASDDSAGLTPLADAPLLDAMQVARLAMDQLASDLPGDPLLPLYVAPAFLGPSKP